MPIPEFIDRYYLPPGEHICTIDEIKERFSNSSPMRMQVWACFENLLNRLEHLKIKPSIILIDGSFVTGRMEPEDVDFACLIEPDKVREAMQEAQNNHDRSGIVLLLNPNNQGPIRDMFGAHALVVDNITGLEHWSMFFRCGGPDGLRDPDPNRDPDWVIKTNEKGILRVML